MSSRALLAAELCPAPGERGSPAALSEARELGTGPRGSSPLPSRGAAGEGAPAAGSPSALCGRRRALRAPSHPSRVGGNREGTREMLSFARRCGSLHSRPSLFFSSLLRTSPGSGSKIPKPGKKEKARGRGRCRLRRPRSPPVGRQQRCDWRRGAARGRRRGGPRLSAGSAADGPETGSGGGRAPRAEREEGPRGAARPPRRAGCSWAGRARFAFRNTARSSEIIRETPFTCGELERPRVGVEGRKAGRVKDPFSPVPSCRVDVLGCGPNSGRRKRFH